MVSKTIIEIGVFFLLVTVLLFLVLPWYVVVGLFVLGLVALGVAAFFLAPELAVAGEAAAAAGERGFLAKMMNRDFKAGLANVGKKAAAATTAAAAVNVANIRSPAPSAPATPAATKIVNTPTPRTPINIKALLKPILLLAGLGAGAYFPLTYMGLNSIPALVAIGIVIALVIGAVKGNPLCVLAAWTSAFLFAIVLVAYFSGGNAILTFTGMFAIFIASLALPTINGKRTKAVAILLVVTTIILGIVVFRTDTLQKFVSPGSQIQRSLDALGKSFTDMWNSFTVNLPGLFKQGQLTIQREINIATGDYESGVQAQTSKQLGVFLENLGLTETKVRQDGVVDLYARLRAESFTTTDFGEPLLITIKCYEDKTKKTGAIRPQDTFTVEEYETFDIDCLFDGRELQKGSNTLALEATFDFSTSAFLKSYFMDQETIRSYTRQRQDPLDAFQITDKKPIAVYTPGPMRLGMNAGTQPIPLVADREEGPTLGLTIERAWLDGELVDLKEITITVPPGLVIDKISGIDPTTSCTSSASGEQVCTLDKTIISKIVTDLTKPFTTVRIFTKKRDSAKLLGGAPLAIRSFKTDIKYTYRIKKLQTVQIVEAT